MALRFMDSFDHYSSLTDKWTGQSGAIIQAFGGRFSTSSGRVAELGAAPHFYKDIDNQATWICGFSFQTSSLAFTGSPALLMAFSDGGTAQCGVWLRNTGKLYIARGTTGVSADSTATIVIDTNYYIELKTTINNTGSYELRVNGATDLIDASEDTQQSANAYANRILFHGSNASSSPFLTADVDDVYVCDGTGSAPTNDFLGDVRIEALFPSGNGNSSQWVGQDSDSTDNYLNVDEATPDSDTTYNESDTVGNKDTYAYADLSSATGTVYGVQVLPYAKKTAAGARSIVSVARLSSTEVDSSAKVLGTSYAYLPDIREAKPGGGAWTISDVNSSEFGVKVSA